MLVTYGCSLYNIFVLLLTKYCRNHCFEKISDDSDSAVFFCNLFVCLSVSGPKLISPVISASGKFMHLCSVYCILTKTSEVQELINLLTYSLWNKGMYLVQRLATFT